MSKMRLPNGYGQIARLKNQKLRNPYRVRVVAERDPLSRLPVKYRTLGYFRTYAEAQAALSAFHAKPHALSKPLLLREVYDAWKRQADSVDDLARQTSYIYKNAWDHIQLKNYYINEIRAVHIRDSLADPALPASVPRVMLIVYRYLFDFAVEERLVSENVARQIKLPKVAKTRAESIARPKSAFSLEELEAIKSRVGSSRIADALFYSCFSGWRPREMCALTPASVNLPMGFVNGGSKTAAGKDRAVPIHAEAAEILRRYVRKPELFGLGYSVYLRGFQKLMAELGIIGHTPHDARRTFITLAKAAGVDEYALKRIVGHAVSDITDSRFFSGKKARIYAVFNGSVYK